MDTDKDLAVVVEHVEEANKEITKVACAFNFCDVILAHVVYFCAIAGSRNSAEKHPLQNHVRLDLWRDSPYYRHHCIGVSVLQVQVNVGF